MTSVEYTDKAIDHLEGLDPPTAERVMDKVEEATEWTEHRLDRLANYDYYKLRVGDYRAIITWDREEDPNRRSGGPPAKRIRSPPSPVGFFMLSLWKKRMLAIKPAENVRNGSC